MPQKLQTSRHLNTKLGETPFTLHTKQVGIELKINLRVRNGQYKGLKLEHLVVKKTKMFYQTCLFFVIKPAIFDFAQNKLKWPDVIQLSVETLESVNKIFVRRECDFFFCLLSITKNKNGVLKSCKNQLTSADIWY